MVVGLEKKQVVGKHSRFFPMFCTLCGVTRVPMRRSGEVIASCGLLKQHPSELHRAQRLAAGVNMSVQKLF